jgi:outer membrane lipoprotein LolB
MPTTTLPSSEAPVTAAAPLRFSISGKIGVRTVKQSGSAFYAWAQDDERFAIDLTGALGIGQTHIEGIPGKVTLNSAKTGLISATTPEELLEQATGWQAPISYLPHWIEGQMIEPTSNNTRDTSQRLLTLTEGGWDVIFEYEQAESKLPSRLVMLQVSDSTAQKQRNRVILTVIHEAAPQ